MKKMIFKTLIFLFFLLPYLSNSKIISLTETYYYGKNMSENQACDMALDLAKKKAADSLGETITSDSILQCKETNIDESCKQFSNIWTESQGTIKNLSNKIKTGFDKELNRYFCEQTISAKIIKSVKPDPNFDFEIKLNRNVFQIDYNDFNVKKNVYSTKENLKIIISPLSNMYMNIFYYSPSISSNIYNEIIYKLFPTPDCSKSLIKNKVIYPNSICNKNMKLTYSKKDFFDKENAQEFLLLIATKDKIKFKDKYTIKSLKDKINEIDQFNIRKKNMAINVYFNK